MACQHHLSGEPRIYSARIRTRRRERNFRLARENRTMRWIRINGLLGIIISPRNVLIVRRSEQRAAGSFWIYLSPTFLYISVRCLRVLLFLWATAPVGLIYKPSATSAVRKHCAAALGVGDQLVNPDLPK